ARRLRNVGMATPATHELAEVDVADLGAVEAAHAGGDGIAGCAHVVSFRIGPACGPAHSSRARPAAGTRPPLSLLAASWDIIAPRPPSLRHSLAARQPFGARLAPDVGRVALVGRRHPARPAVARAQPLRDALRSRVVRIDAVAGVVPFQLRERPVQLRARGLGGVAPSPGVAVEGPADLVARPALRPPRAGLADVAAAGLLDDREHREALQGPGTGHLQEATPRRGARQLPADEARGFLVAQHLRVAIEDRKS